MQLKIRFMVLEFWKFLKKRFTNPVWHEFKHSMEGIMSRIRNTSTLLNHKLELIFGVCFNRVLIFLGDCA